MCSIAGLTITKTRAIIESEAVDQIIFLNKALKKNIQMMDLLWKMNLFSLIDLEMKQEKNVSSSFRLTGFLHSRGTGWGKALRR